MGTASCGRAIISRRNTGRLIVPAVSALFLAYFGFHAYHGEYGIYSKYRYEAEAVELQARLDTARSQRMDMERRVQLLHDGTLEKDMLDEQARRALNLSQIDEIVIMRKGDFSQLTEIWLFADFSSDFRRLRACLPCVFPHGSMLPTVLASLSNRGPLPLECPQRDNNRE